MKHNFTFTSTVVGHLLEVDKPSTIYFKSDNCATQYGQSLILHEMLTFTGCLTLGKLRECKDILRTNELQKTKIEKFSFRNFEFPCFLGKYNSSY